MKISIDNYQDIIGQIGVSKLNDAEKEAHSIIVEGSDNFQNLAQLRELMDDPDIGETIQLYFDRLEGKAASASSDSAVVKKKAASEAIFQYGSIVKVDGGKYSAYKVKSKPYSDNGITFYDLEIPSGSIINRVRADEMTQGDIEDWMDFTPVKPSASSATSVVKKPKAEKKPRAASKKAASSDPREKYRGIEIYQMTSGEWTGKGIVWGAPTRASLIEYIDSHLDAGTGIATDNSAFRFTAKAKDTEEHKTLVEVVKSAKPKAKNQKPKAEKKPRTRTVNIPSVELAILRSVRNMDGKTKARPQVKAIITKIDGITPVKHKSTIELIRSKFAKALEVMEKKDTLDVKLTGEVRTYLDKALAEPKRTNVVSKRVEGDNDLKVNVNVNYLEGPKK